MCRNLLFVVIVGMFLSACVVKQNIAIYKDYEKHKSKDFDLRVVKALTYSQFGNFQEARDEFLALFKDYNVTAFLENAYLLTLANNLDKVDEINELAKPYLNRSDNLKRFSVLYSLQRSDLQRARKLVKELLAKNTDDARDFELYGDILVAKNDPKGAIKYFQLAYRYFPNEDILLKIIGLYAVLNDTKDIKVLLEDFRRANGCTLRICVLLSKIYSDEKNIEALKVIYVDLYELNHNKDFILNLIELLNSQGRKQEALELALKYDVNDDIKIFLYQGLRKFDEAKDLSLQVYKQGNNKEYLLRAAIFEFEAASLKGQITVEKVNEIVKSIEKAVDQDTEALYLNFYGYLLIDHDLDVKRGMEWVKIALEKEPDNLYYIDSLAWGHYKLGECKEAWELLQKVFGDKEFMDSKESKAHIEAVKECLKNDSR